MKRYNWYTSDQHYGHANIIEFCGRPQKDVSDMNEDMVYRYNSVVKPEDTVMLLGDLCMGKLADSLRYVEKLNGVKTLLCGNHDKMFGTAPGSDKRKRCEAPYFDAGISEILYGQVTTTIDRWAVTLCHFPRVGDTTFKDRYSEHRPKRGGILLHGHTHGRWRTKEEMIDVGCDSWGGYPVGEDALADVINGGHWFLERLAWTPYDNEGEQ